MSWTRLLHVDSCTLSIFLLTELPPFIAVSHVWSDALFPTRVELRRQKGFKAVKQVIFECHPTIEYCWIDILCIDQNDHDDKMRQIPLMQTIFGQAEVVAVVLNAELNLTQEEIDGAVARIEGALKMWSDSSWEDYGYQWITGGGVERLMDVADVLEPFTRTSWATRVWTLQEYMLARYIIWIGDDLTPLILDEELFFAIPEICFRLGITEYTRRPATRSSRNFRDMAKLKLNEDDKSRVMELLGNRNATVPVDEVFGAMAASGIMIDTQGIAQKEEAWRLWWEKAVTLGHLRWILFTPFATMISLNRPQRYPESNCVMPSFSTRHVSSGGLEISKIEKSGEVKVREGVVTLPGRWAGVCRIGPRLGRLHRGAGNITYAGISLVLLAACNWRCALGIVRALSDGKFTFPKLLVIARLLIDNFQTVEHAVATNTEPLHKMVFREPRSRSRNIWLDFLHLQSANIRFLLNGVIYLAQLFNEKYCTDIAIVTDSYLAPGKHLLALDFGALDSDYKVILTIVEVSDDHLNEPTSAHVPAHSFHKIGMATTSILGRPSRIKRYSAFGLSDTRLYSLSIGGKRCFRCGGSEHE